MTSNDYTIAVVGSHSALDICRGAKNQGFKTLVIVEPGRDKTYSYYYKTNGKLGCVDDVLEVKKFKDILNPDVQKKLKSKNCIFIPHRSFEVYVNNYNAIENDFKVPMFGNRKLLRCEERGTGDDLDQYKIMDEAGIKYPKQIKNPKFINTLAIVKILEKGSGFKRANFLISSEKDFELKKKRGIKNGDFTEEQLKKAVIEEFVAGPDINLNFFYSPIGKRLELVGTDSRRRTNFEGIYKLSWKLQDLYREKGGRIRYEEAGHIATTLLESMLEQAFEMGERFVKATKKLSPPGVIGPFALQCMIAFDEKNFKKEFIVFDVSPRMPGSPGISATPYSKYLFGEPLSMGDRVAMEIKRAIEKNQLGKITT